MDLFYGVFDTYAGAAKFTAELKQVGWQNEALAELLVQDADVDAPKLFQTSQFAVMLQLSKLLRPGSTVLDLGGAGGVFYEICDRYGLLKPPLTWHVVDMPKMVERGRERHAELGSQMISFGTELSQAPEADIMLMLGVIQYMQDPFGEHGQGLLESMATPPDHILINKIPLTDAPDAWSVQNHVTSAAPYRLFNRQKFTAYFERHGYRLRDRWLVPELTANIPFHPQRALKNFEGLYFARSAAPA